MKKGSYRRGKTVAAARASENKSEKQLISTEFLDGGFCFGIP
jgi:hypothetical protein